MCSLPTMWIAFFAFAPSMAMGGTCIECAKTQMTNAVKECGKDAIGLGIQALQQIVPDNARVLVDSYTKDIEKSLPTASSVGGRKLQASACPANYPVCHSDGDCVISACSGGGCIWREAPNPSTSPVSGYNFITMSQKCGNHYGYEAQDPTPRRRRASPDLSTSATIRTSLVSGCAACFEKVWLGFLSICSKSPQDGVNEKMCTNDALSGVCNQHACLPIASTVVILAPNIKKLYQPTCECAVDALGIFNESGGCTLSHASGRFFSHLLIMLLAVFAWF